VVRVWQARTLEVMFARYIDAAADPLPIVWRGDDDDPPAAPGMARVSTEAIVPPLDPAAWTAGSLRAEVVRAELGGPACRGRDVIVTLPYRTEFGARVLQIPAIFRWSTPADGATTVFFPIYRALVGMPAATSPSGQFRTLGIDLRTADVPCLHSLARLRDPKAFPLQFAVNLGPDWRRDRRYQVLASLGGPTPP
jgi:hypothetical protein